MNVLFLTLCEYASIYERDLYTDLLRVFMENGDKVFLISPIQRRNKEKTQLIREGNATILRLKTGNVEKTNTVEKGISTILMESVFRHGIEKYLSDVKFDLVLYSTPPITLVGAVEYVKKRDNAYTYLLLKDIFPQNAVDLGMMSIRGVRGILYNYFRKKEIRMYRMSDRIGCMSAANVDYVINNNPEIDPSRVEVCPNSIEIIDKSVDKKTRDSIREKYNIPKDKTVFIYGGNLGKPQGIPFIIECLKAIKNTNEAFFLIVGDGTEYRELKDYSDNSEQSNFKLLNRLPKDDYDNMVGACDIGMIFLDHRFTIPNFPSRIISYMQAKIPVLAATDLSTDIGKVIMDGGFGWWCESNSVEGFVDVVQTALQSNLPALGQNSWEKLNELYDVKDSYKTIVNSL